LDAIPTETLKQASVLFINYPNNPTGAVATPEFYKHVSDIAEDYNLLVVSDNPYSEFTYGDYVAPSFLETNPNHLEINSCSKIFNMTGFRCGWAYGGEDAVSALKSAKSQVDSGCPMFVQRAAIAALQTYTSAQKPPEVASTMELYESRMKVLVDGLNAIGWPVKMPNATFYLWAKCPPGEEDDMAFAMKLIEVGVVITPGVGFGDEGNGFVRFAVTQPEERIKEALERIAQIIQ
jgi:LL-diaminopimelate aminotransferase